MSPKAVGSEFLHKYVGFIFERKGKLLKVYFLLSLLLSPFALRVTSINVGSFFVLHNPVKQYADGAERRAHLLNKWFHVFQTTR
jgi:hypothetical protein